MVVEIVESVWVEASVVFFIGLVMTGTKICLCGRFRNTASSNQTNRFLLFTMVSIIIMTTLLCFTLRVPTLLNLRGIVLQAVKFTKKAEVCTILIKFSYNA